MQMILAVPSKVLMRTCMGPCLPDGPCAAPARTGAAQEGAGGGAVEGLQVTRQVRQGVRQRRGAPHHENYLRSAPPRPPPRLHHTAAAPRPRCQPCERHRTVTTVPLPREYPRGPDRASLTRLRSQVAQLLELPLVFTSRGESHHKSQLSSNRTRTMFLCQNANDMARHDPVHWGGVHPHEASLPDSWASRKDG